MRLQEQLGGLDSAEPVICDLCWCQNAQPVALQQRLAAREKQQREHMGLRACQREARGQSWEQENQRASGDTGETAELRQAGRKERVGGVFMGQGHM